MLWKKLINCKLVEAKKVKFSKENLDCQSYFVYRFSILIGSYVFIINLRIS